MGIKKGLGKLYFFVEILFNRLILSFKIPINFYRFKFFTAKLEPFNLLSQLLLTYLTVHEGEFVSESAEVVLNARYIEYLIGFLCTQKRIREKSKKADSRDLEKLMRLIKSYFTSIRLFNRFKNTKQNYKNSLITDAKLYSLIVRGESYPSQIYLNSIDLYSNFNDWFENKLGFTISDAVVLSKSIKRISENKVNEEKKKRRLIAEDYINQLVKQGKIEENEKRVAVISCFFSIYFGKSEEIVPFTLVELVEFSKIDKQICESFLSRMSQEFGYRNKFFQNVHRNPFKSPWDYNTIYEKPIIRNDSKYYVFLPSILPEVILNTFYYDLIQDSSYWIKEGEKRYGKWLEERVAKCLEKTFPKSQILRNPIGTDKNEICDVLILSDRKVFIFQCKTKRLSYESRNGVDFEKLKIDFEKGIKESFRQSINAKKYLLSTEFPKVIIDDNEIIIDQSQITKFVLISVTFQSYQNLTTRLANLDDSLDISIENQYPWAISLFDLEILCEILDKPYLFIHYARRRTQIEKTKFKILGDEVDLLGFYLDQGLYFEGDDFKKLDMMILSGYSDDIDEYFFKKYETKKNPKKPGMNFSKIEKKYIESINKLKVPFKTDCILRLLDMSNESRETILNNFELLKKRTIRNGKMQTMSTIMKDRKFGFSFVVLNPDATQKDLYRQLFSYSSMKKYEERCNEWVGIGWIKNNKKLVNLVLYLEGKETYNPIMEEILLKQSKWGNTISKQREEYFGFSEDDVIDS